MITKAVARYIRISPRKTKQVTDLLKGLPVVKAKAVLEHVEKSPALYIKRLLSSAIDSADKRFSVLPSELYISLIKVDKGPMVKRYRAATMGRAGMIRHRTSHITLILDKKQTVKKEVNIPKKASSPKVKSNVSGKAAKSVKTTKTKKRILKKK